MDGTPLPDESTLTVKGMGVDQPGLKLIQGQASFSFQIPADFSEEMYGVTLTVTA